MCGKDNFTSLLLLIQHFEECKGNTMKDVLASIPLFFCTLVKACQDLLKKKKQTKTFNAYRFKNL